MTPLVLRAGAALSAIFLSSVAGAQDRPSEADMFGGTSAPTAPAAPASPDAKPNPAPVSPAPADSAPAPVAAPPGSPAATAESASPSPSAAPNRDSQILGAGETPMFSEDTAPEDPLKIGGQLYLRAQTTGSRGQSPSDWAFS